MDFNKKGQAATEFLMTYGWALLLILIVVGALYSMGIFEPGIGEKCIPRGPFGACGVKLVAGGGAVNEISVKWSEKTLADTPSLVSVAVEGRPECTAGTLTVVSSCPRCGVIVGSGLGTCTLNAPKTGCIAGGGAVCALDTRYLCSPGAKQSFTCNHGLKKGENYRGKIVLRYAGESGLQHDMELEVSGVVQ